VVRPAGHVRGDPGALSVRTTERIDVLGVEVDALDRAGFLARLEQAVERGDRHHHLSVNASKLVRLQHDPTLRRAAAQAGTVAADGVGVVWAARWLGTPLPERVAGCDLMGDVLERAAQTGWRVALLGATHDVVEAVAAQQRARGVHVVWVRDGWFGPDEERGVAEQIAAARAQVLLVAMGSPRTEHFVVRWFDVLDVPLVMGVGGSFDVLAGTTRRAPERWQRAGLEWAWRLAESPRVRFRRAVVDGARFVLHVARQRP
jgi:N-acetylglucosaminyldiphosphoundecaprenol N-acetyl-beta-D-mannosaminyltransferase